jgi:hypothetical protein
MVVNPETQSRDGQSSTAAGTFAIICFLLSWAALHCEIYLSPDLTPLPILESEEVFWFFPLPVLILFRRIKQITMPFAVMFFVIAIGRYYYFLQFIHFEAHVTRFDWAVLLQSIVGRISVAVFGFWLVVRLFIFLSDALNSSSGAASDE